MGKFGEGEFEHIIVFIILRTVPGQIAPGVAAIDVTAIFRHDIGFGIVSPKPLKQVLQDIEITVVELAYVFMAVLLTVAGKRFRRGQLIQINAITAVGFHAELRRVQQILPPKLIRWAVDGKMFRPIGFIPHFPGFRPYGHFFSHQLVEIRFQVKNPGVDIQRGHTAVLAHIFQSPPEFHGAAQLHIRVILGIEGVKACPVPACDKHMPGAPGRSRLVHLGDIPERMFHVPRPLKIVALV